jgi:hypothetical protein
MPKICDINCDPDPGNEKLSTAEIDVTESEAMGYETIFCVDSDFSCFKL